MNLFRVVYSSGAPGGASKLVLFWALLLLQLSLTPAWAKTYAEIDYEQVTQIARLLTETPQGLTPPCQDRNAWSESQLRARLEPVLRKANILITGEFPAWSDEKYLEFSRTGERKRGDEMMHARRSWILPLVLAECGEYQGRFIPQIERVLAELIDQKTWVLPANDGDLDVFYGRKQFVELYSAELAEELAEAVYLLQDKIDPGIRKRVLNSLEVRIFSPLRDSFISDKGHWWLKSTSNWNPVCLKGATGAALTVLPDRFDRALFTAAAIHYSKNYIAGFPDDGYAVEGLHYWNYGFGRFTEMRERVWRATGERVDLFDNRKIQNIALFGARIPMFPNIAAAFGDSVLGVKPDPTILSYVRTALGRCLSDSPPRVSSARLFLLFPGTQPPLNRQCERPGITVRDYFDKSGVLVARPLPGSRSRLAVTIKAGGNGPHSHNDIGSYAVALGDQQPVGDPGGLRYYSRRTFGAHRYESKVLNSYGHPVPVVAGQLQVDATKVIPRVLSTSFSDIKDEMVVDMASAYAVPDLKLLTRSMRYDRSGTGSVTIEDVYEFRIPRDFEVALTTHGQWSQVDSTTLVFDAGGKKLQATIDAPGSFDIHSEKISENGIEFDRIGIRLVQPRISGRVRVLFVERH